MRRVLVRQSKPFAKPSSMFKKKLISGNHLMRTAATATAVTVADMAPGGVFVLRKPTESEIAQAKANLRRLEKAASVLTASTEVVEPRLRSYAGGGGYIEDVVVEDRRATL